MITIHHKILRPQYTSNKIHPLTKMNLDKWGLLNKEINLIQKIWSHDECLKFLKTFSEQYGKDILYWFNYEQDGRYKSDIVRLCILFEFGGIYVDVDQEPLISFSEYLDFNKYDFCAASNMGLHNVSNGFIYVKKNYNIIKNHYLADLY